MVLSINKINAVLTATTANTIQGSPPYFVTSGVNKVDLKDFRYFGLTYNGADYYTAASLGTVLESAGYKVATHRPQHLFTTPGSASNKFALATLLQPLTVEVIDDDGDGNPSISALTVNPPAIKGWYYKNSGGAEIALSGSQIAQTFCQLAGSGISPYLKITGNIDLNTQYGDPHNQTYPDTTSGLGAPIRNFPIIIGGGVCAARPNMTYSTGNYRGPTTEWDPVLGFLPQVAPKLNFPTTGANNLNFELIVAGADATTLTWPTKIVGGVTATMTPVNSSIVKVNLTGPKASSTAIGATAVAFSGSPTSPLSFIIEGKSGGSTLISYPFSLKKWYVNRGGFKDSVKRQEKWCENLSHSGYYNNYILSSVRELTNASHPSLTTLPPGYPAPLSPYGHYQRRIGGGLLVEWGSVNHISGASFSGDYYWMYDFDSFTTSYSVYLPYGMIVGHQSTNSRLAVCVSL